MSLGDRHILRSQAVAVLLVAASLGGAHLFIEWKVRAGSWQGGAGNAISVRLLALFWSMLVMLGFGAWRAIGLHPANNRTYREWLTGTPWNAGMPLPLGPVGLQPLDLAVVLIAAPLFGVAALADTFLAPYSVKLSLIAAAIGVIGYLVGAAYIFARCFVKTRIIGLLIVAPLALLLPGAVPKMAVLMALVAIADLGLRSTLKSFPWTAPPSRVPMHALGYPFGSLRPVLVVPSLSSGQGFGFAILLGWWAFALAWLRQQFLPTPFDDVEAMCLFIGIIAAVARVAVYCDGYLPTLGPISRLVLKRWIMPEYDYVLLAPIAAVVFSWVLPLVCEAARLPSALSFGISVTGIFSAILEFGPTVHSWRLTGGHRMAMPLFRSSLQDPKSLRNSTPA